MAPQQKTFKLETLTTVALRRLSDVTGSTETATVGAALALYYRETFGQQALLDLLAQADQLEAPEKRSVRGQRAEEGTETPQTAPSPLLGLPVAAETVDVASEASPAALTEQASPQAEGTTEQQPPRRRVTVAGETPTDQLETPRRKRGGRNQRKPKAPAA